MRCAATMLPKRKKASWSPALIVEFKFPKVPPSFPAQLGKELYLVEFKR
jgi:hypothetical protein